MATEVDICNLALSAIRAQSINDLDEQSNQARVCKLHYPFVRDRLMSESDWGFNSKIKPLELLISSVHGWLYTYKYPTDCARINKMVRNDTVTPVYPTDTYDQRLDDLPLIEYKTKNVDGERVIVSNVPNLWIDYRAYVTDVSLFNADIIKVIQYLLASEIAVPIIGNKDGQPVRAQMLVIYAEYLAMAKANNASEEYAHTPESEFVSIRG